MKYFDPGGSVSESSSARVSATVALQAAGRELPDDDRSAGLDPKALLVSLV
jgi:hypothetical protein